MGRAARVFFVFLIIVLLCGGGVAFWGYGVYLRPGPLDRDVTLIIPRGASLTKITRLLVEAGVLDDAVLFRSILRLSDQGGTLQAGEYLFPAQVTMRGVIQTLVQGQTVVRRFTIAEGLRTAQIVDLLKKIEGLEGLVPDDLNEGAFLPETYHFSYGDRRTQVIKRMKSAQESFLASAWSKRSAELPLSSPYEAIILASIVEKETSIAAERAHVAGVFINRLRRGMRLQSDPTVAYGLSPEKSLGRALTRQDLKSQTRFNTYIIDGLPPEPICNPGADAILAALNPRRTEDLYFVADGKGGHIFARTLAQHNRNVRKWRRLQRRQRLLEEQKNTEGTPR